MKKLLMLCAVGLLLGVAVGTGVAWIRRPPAPPPPELAADSADIDAAGASLPPADTDGDSATTTQRFDTEPVPLTGPGDDRSVPASAAQTTAGSAASATTTGTGASAQRAPAGAAADTGEVERMSQIFGTMKPQEAARVLERLDDRQVEALLLGLTDRKAAAILASLPAERAAALTRSILARQQP